MNDEQFAGIAQAQHNVMIALIRTAAKLEAARESILGAKEELRHAPDMYVDAANNCLDEAVTRLDECLAEVKPKDAASESAFLEVMAAVEQCLDRSRKGEQE